MRRMTVLLASMLIGVLGSFVAAPAAEATPAPIPAHLRLTVSAPVTVPPAGGGFGGAAEWDSTNITDVGASLKTSEILIDVGGGTAHRSFGIDLRAPTGQPFHLGHYFGDDPYGVRGDGSLNFSTASCDQVSFTILDLAVSGTTISRLDVQFQDPHRCSTPISGELQVGEPDPAPGLLAGVRSFSWGDVPVGTVSTQVVPVWFRNTATTSVTLGSAALAGPDPADFALALDTCSKHTLAPGAGCSMQALFGPRAAGLRSATVLLPAGSAVARVGLTGVGPEGRTVLLINSQPGDFVGAGLSSVITEAQAPMTVYHLGLDSFDASIASRPNLWSVSIRTPDGRPLALGTHPASNDPTGSAYTLNIEGYGRGCGGSVGSVTINQAVFDTDNAPVTFDATFSQTCVGSGGKFLTGEIAYRATNTPTAPTAPFVLRTGQNLLAGHAKTDFDGSSDTYRLAVGVDGRATIRDNDGPVLWATPTAGTGTSNRLQIFADGTLAILTSDNRLVWHVYPAGHQPGDFLVLQSDGNLVLYSPGYVPLWSSGTAQAPS